MTNTSIGTDQPWSGTAARGRGERLTLGRGQAHVIVVGVSVAEAATANTVGTLITWYEVLVIMTASRLNKCPIRSG